MQTTEVSNPMQAFHEEIFRKQMQTEVVPPNDEIGQWAIDLIGMLFPAFSGAQFVSREELQTGFATSQLNLCRIMDATRACKRIDNDSKAGQFFAKLPELYRVLNTDIDALLTGDPAAQSEFEVVRAYPGFFAICLYRLAHGLYELNVPVIPRILTEFAHSRTGIDIHPAATLGEYVFIDHGTGIVIGETAVIGNRVKLYQGVTLGALSVHKSMAFTKRHPTVEDNVVIYSGATILGGETVIGKDSVIGGNVWLTRSVPPGSRVYHKASIEVVINESIE